MTDRQMETITLLQSDIRALELMRTRLETQILKNQACIEEILAQRDHPPFPFPPRQGANAPRQQPRQSRASKVYQSNPNAPTGPSVPEMVKNAAKLFNGSEFTFVALKEKTIELYPAHEELIRRGIYTALRGPYGLISKGVISQNERGLCFTSHETST